MEERTGSGVGYIVTLERGAGVQLQQDKVVQVKLQSQRQRVTVTQLCQVGKETHSGTTGGGGPGSEKLQRGVGEKG